MQQQKRPSEKLKLRKYFYVEIFIVLLLLIGFSFLIVYPWLATLHPIFEPTGLPTEDEQLTIRELIMVIIMLVGIVGHSTARMAIGPNPTFDPYTPPMSFPDGDWTELVLTPMVDNEFWAPLSKSNLEELPDLVPPSTVAAAEDHPVPVCIDREALESVFSDAQSMDEYYRDIGPTFWLPRNWPKKRQREEEVTEAREQLAKVSHILDTLPPQNVSYERSSKAE